MTAQTIYVRVDEQGKVIADSDGRLIAFIDYEKHAVKDRTIMVGEFHITTCHKITCTPEKTEYRG